MRPRTDFYTHCPQCESKISLPLAAKLQASRAGAQCSCSKCQHEWICIQEWIYREMPATPSIKMNFIPSAVPRPHMMTSSPHPAENRDAAETSNGAHAQIPTPHAWSFDRQPVNRMGISLER